MEKKYDERHGGPFDRGSADSYYHRSRKPRYFVGDTYASEQIEEKYMSDSEIEAYNAGYDQNEEDGFKKEW